MIRDAICSNRPCKEEMKQSKPTHDLHNMLELEETNIKQFL